MLVYEVLNKGTTPIYVIKGVKPGFPNHGFKGQNSGRVGFGFIVKWDSDGRLLISNILYSISSTMKR